MVRGMPFDGTGYLWPDAEGITSNLVLLATISGGRARRAPPRRSGDDRRRVLGDRTGPAGAARPRGADRAADARPRLEPAILAGVRHEWESYERVLDADPWSDGEPAPKLVALRHQLLSPNP